MQLPYINVWLLGTLHATSVQSQNPWYYEVSKCSPQQALRDLDKAFKNFLTIPKRGFPKFKKKGKKDSFYLEGSIKIIQGNYIQLPRIGRVKTYEILPSVPVKNVRISKRAGDWYISFKYECESKPPTKKRGVIGVDVGINTLATCSDGSKFAFHVRDSGNVKAYKQAKKRLTRYQWRVKKKEPGSKNRAKAVKRLAKAHKKADATPRRRQLACGTRTKQ